MEREVLLQMVDISKSFPGVKALDKVSLTVHKGTVHALMGENGAGKSTLMKCLFGMYAKDSGHVYLEGKDTLDLAGGVLNLFYDNGTSSEVPLSEAAVSGFNNTVVGAQTLTVTYKDKHCTFGITIQPKSLTSISIKALPKKLSYFECSGALDLFGGVLTLSYNNDTSAELPLSDATVSVSGFDNTTVGPQTLTVSYKDKMCTFEVEILPAYELTANATTGTYQLTTYANPQEATLVIAYYGKSGQLISSTHTEVKLQVGQTISGTYDTSIPCNMMLLSTVPAPLCKAVTPLP